MSNEIVERLAFKLAEKLCVTDNKGDVITDVADLRHAWTDIGRHDLIEAAQAALQVVAEILREPSVEMMEAGDQARPFKDDEGDDDLIRLNTEGTWQAMLQASPLCGREEQ